MAVRGDARTAADVCKRRKRCHLDVTQAAAKISLPRGFSGRGYASAIKFRGNFSPSAFLRFGIAKSATIPAHTPRHLIDDRIGSRRGDSCAQSCCPGPQALDDV